MSDLETSLAVQDNDDYVDPFYGQVVRKSNKFISASYTATLLENRIISIALSRIEAKYDKDADNGRTLIARLYPSELAMLIGKTHVYRDLKKVSQTITGRSILIEDGNGNFHTSAIITDCDYEDSILTIRFNDRLKKHIFNLEKNYTSLDLSTMIGFHKNSSFRLYELLKKEAYRIKEGENNNAVTWTIGLSEFKFAIGLVDSDSPAVRAAMAEMKGDIDWDVLYDAASSTDKSYETWWNLKARVLEPAKEELELRSNIRFDYEGLRVGRKIGRIRFTIYKNDPEEKENDTISTKASAIAKSKESLTFVNNPEYKDLYEEFVSHNKLEAIDLDMLLKKANFDKEKVRRAIYLADKQDNIRNYIGWLVRCIEDGYEEPIVVASGSNEKGEQYEVIKQNLKDNEGELSGRFWERIKLKDDYPLFEEYILKTEGISVEDMELISTPNECVAIYTDWLRNKKKTM